ncbi:MAG: DUF3617 family protein [Burkholderiales bacterium]|nr:DUF3617 family protein [Burkholderiales bacterium]
MATRIVPLLATGVCFAWSAAQAGSADLWEVTAFVTMRGMGMMAAPPIEVCAGAGQSDRLTPMPAGCRITDRSTAGDRTSFRVACAGKPPTAGTGEITTGQGVYHAVLRLTGKMDDEPLTMTTEYSGRLIGKCAAAK